MRLINSETLKVEMFTEFTPKYAILSHTWGENEITLQDMQSGTAVKKQAGYKKIEKCCSVAAGDGFDFVWIDTCCIDKTSSAELSEAINSMFRWYQKAEVCYAYLSDVPSRQDPRHPGSFFSMSRWFRRGWTLQELIAPSIVTFFNRDWQEIGTKSSLSRVISKITTIPVNMLLEGDLGKASVAQKMSWASARRTTRLEDIAYCLLGIFDIHMPLLYGEGQRSFIRLQEEIMNVSDDHSLFSWRAPYGQDDEPGLLASSPQMFREAANIIRYNDPRTVTTPLTVSNKGYHITLPLLQQSDGCYVAVLNCVDNNKNGLRQGILLKDLDNLRQHFARHRCDELANFDEKQAKKIPVKTIYVRRWLPGYDLSDVYQTPRRCWIELAGINKLGLILRECYPHKEWMEMNGLVVSETAAYDGIFGALKFENAYGDDFALVLKKRKDVLCANLIMNVVSETLEQIFWSFGNDSRAVTRREWQSGLDRIFRPQSSRSWPLYIAIRRQIKAVYGEKRTVDILTLSRENPYE